MAAGLPVDLVVLVAEASHDRAGKAGFEGGVLLHDDPSPISGVRMARNRFCAAGAKSPARAMVALLRRLDRAAEAAQPSRAAIDEADVDSEPDYLEHRLAKITGLPAEP
jgi:hypothetical protein